MWFKKKDSQATAAAAAIQAERAAQNAAYERINQIPINEAMAALMYKLRPGDCFTDGIYELGSTEQSVTVFKLDGIAMDELERSDAWRQVWDIIERCRARERGEHGPRISAEHAAGACAQGGYLDYGTADQGPDDPGDPVASG